MSDATKLAHPELYGADARLLGVRCTDCGRVAFPRQHYGCEACGSVRSEDVELEPRGTLLSYATVHLHASKSIAPPFVIGEIGLAGGPTLRLTLVESDDGELRIGAPMRGVLHPAPGGEGALELRFTRESAR